MNEPVDKMLTGRIRQVFENFEDPSADAGWEELRKKYPVRNRRPLILWLSTAAAILMLATGLWFVDQSEEMIAIKPAKDQGGMINSKKAPQFNTEEQGNEVLQNNKPVLSQRKGTANVQNTGELKQALSHPAENKEEDLNLSIAKVQHDSVLEPIVVSERADEIRMAKAASLVVKNPAHFSPTPIDPVKKPVYIKEFNPDPAESGTGDKRSDEKTKKLALSVFAGSYLNYSEGSENQLNFGAGFNSDIRLSKNLKFSTGLSIASHSLSYDNAQDLPSSAYASFDSKLNQGSGNLTTITSYNANLLALDIPLNIKYQFVPESDRFYVLAGLSSGTFLNETYAYYYRNFSTASGNYVSQTQDQKIKKQLSNFDLGQTLNLSLGLSRNFGKTQTISLEPFLKYPLSGLGSEDLKFGSAGFNLKLRFAPLKK
ncbi:PorT family protein [Flavihumibacter sp. R14]|nr:PorT family protein [Flavihumibacter soli]